MFRRPGRPPAAATATLRREAGVHRPNAIARRGSTTAVGVVESLLVRSRSSLTANAE
jgi:hypothetical protein